MHKPRIRWMIAASCVAALAIAGTATAGTAPGRVALAGTSRTYDFIDHGAVPAGTPVSESIYLAVKDPAALAAQAKAMSDPHSPGYGRFLSRDRIRELHQLDPAQVGHVRDWLTSAGLNVSRPDWRQLRVTGTFAQLNAAFAVTFHDYTFPPETHIQGHYLIPSTELSVPAGLGPLVLGVGQDTILIRDAKAKTAATQRAVRTPHIDAGQAATCSKYWGELPAKGLPQANGATPPLAPCGYTPQQLRRAYGLDRLNLTGAGQTVAVLSGPMNTLEQDINTWSKHVGTQPLRPGQLTAVPTPDGSPDEDPRDGGAIEATIDAEAVHGLAPDANIVAIGESTAQGTNLLDSLTYVLDRTNASIVSASLGFDPVPGMRKAYDQVFQEGALQGVGFYFCSGDGGFKITDDGRGDWLNPAANSPWETSVGGTSLAIGPDGKRSWETGWGDATSALSPDGASWQAMQSDGGTGGGRAGDRPEPWYQHGVVPDQLATGPDGSHNRVGPDVAMDADPVTGLLVGGTALGGSPTTDPGTWLYTEHKYGGTSLSTPLFAGVQALAQQARGGKPFGFANPIMYQRANSPAFRDVTTYRRPDGNVPTTVSYRPDDKGNNTPTLYSILASQLADGTPDGIVPPEVGPGFDTETGLGTPTTAYLRSFIGS